MKVLIIGLGSIGKKHVTAIKTIIPDAKIYAIRSSKESEHLEGVSNLYNYAEIGSIHPDFAIISNPTSEHKKTISKLIEYGLPLFIEKPLFSSLDILDLIGLINNHKIFTYVACNLRFLSCLQFVKNHISQTKNHRLNEVNVYCGSFLPEWRPSVDFRRTYSAIPEQGGGVHLDLIHELDYLYWLFGTPKEANVNIKNQSSLLVPTVDYANYLLVYEGFCANVVLNYYRSDPKRTLELVFENKTWNVDLLKNQVKCKGKLLYSSEQRIADTYYIQMQYFINCIENKEVTFNSINDAFNVLKICLVK